MNQQPRRPLLQWVFHKEGVSGIWLIAMLDISAVECLNKISPKWYKSVTTLDWHQTNISLEKCDWQEPRTS